MNTDLVMTATVTARKTKKGYKARVSIQCNKFTTGGRVYHSLIRHACDVNAWAARVLVELTSDIEGLNLHAAIRSLETRHGSFKAVYIEMLRGCGYAFNSKCRPYHGAEVYDVVSILPLIKVKKGGL